MQPPLSVSPVKASMLSNASVSQLAWNLRLGQPYFSAWMSRLQDLILRHHRLYSNFLTN